MSPTGLSRRQLLALAGVGGGALALPRPALGKPVSDPVADLYHELLLVHTHWVNAQWDKTTKAYQGADFRFAAVLGNAVLLTSPGYDAAKAGIDHGTLKAHTIATIRRFAATNRLAGGREWGRQLFWDSTFELYFVLAARLLWTELDARTRSRVDAIVRGQAAYAYRLNFGDDPMSTGWSPNGTQGGWTGDTKLEEMGVYAQALAPGLARTPQPGWADRFHFWVSNASGLPVADQANPAVQPRNTAHNILDTFLVENHGSANPHYQAELWRTAGRAAIVFMAAGRPLPAILTNQPNGRELWRTLKLLASDAGEPVMPMVADRYHLYGRDILPLAFLAQVQGDRYAARAEADLAARLMPYLRHGPEYRLTKFGGEEKNEPEARAELAIAYLFHRYRRTPVRPVSQSAFFADAQGTRDFGTMSVQQSTSAFAAAVTQDGFVNFVWQPRHDNWLVDTRAVGFLPPSVAPPETTWSTAYRKDRDGVDATATVLGFGDDRYAGFATLPTGTVVYASTGVGADEGGLSLFNLSMPGVPGLTGTRTFSGASGSVSLSGKAGGGGDGGIDELSFAPRRARYVRMLGKAAANQYGYSIWTFSVLDAAGGDLAQGALAAGSSQDVTYPAYNATDGNPETRWAVDRTQRGRVDGWFGVDLGSAVTISGVRISWEAAYATRYAIQTSTDAVTWTDAVEVPNAHAIGGRWVDIDGRAGLVTHGSARPITVTATGVIAATGTASPALVEGYSRGRADLIAAAVRRMPIAPVGMWVSDADGYLSVFNLTPDRIADAPVAVGSAARLYRGAQIVTTNGLEWTVSMAGGRARVEPPRFIVDPAAPIGTRFLVTDSHHVTVTAPTDRSATLTVRAGSWSERVLLAAGKSRALTVTTGGAVTPTIDLARGRTTFPTSPLPIGMTSPAAAVDGDPRSAWRPGAAGRMVVDLGEPRDLTLIKLTWTRGPRRPVRLSSSVDGLTYGVLAEVPAPGRSAASVVDVAARYVAVAVVGWRPGDAELVEVAILA